MDGPPPAKDTDDGLALFLLGWLAGKCRGDECPVHVDHVRANSYGHISGKSSGNAIVIEVGADGSYETHFDVVTGSGVKLRLEISVIP